MQNSSADQLLIEQIRNGDADGWSQFVSRYQGRMIAFARNQVGTTDCEDLVQDSFVSMLRSLDSYRGESELQSWLFRILRCRIVDFYRSRGTRRELPACSFQDAADSTTNDDFMHSVIDPGDSPSDNVLRHEQHAEDQHRLLQALGVVVDQLTQKSSLFDLMIFEGLFYAKIKNRTLASLLNVDEGRIAVVRHRLLKRLRQAMGEAHRAHTDIEANLLTRVWESSCLSCPKRTTLGKSLIGILEPEWQTYVGFHVDTLGCQVCRANRDDLAIPASKPDLRIFESTVGFMRLPSSDR